MERGEHVKYFAKQFTVVAVAATLVASAFNPGLAHAGQAYGTPAAGTSIVAAEDPALEEDPETDAVPEGDAVPVYVTDGIPVYNEGEEPAAPEVVPGSESDMTEEPTVGEPEPPVPTCQPKNPREQCDTDTNAEYCAPRYVKRVINNVKNDYVETFRTTVRNTTSKPVPADIQVTDTDTVTYGLSVNVEEEFKAWIFAKIKASINMSVAKSMTTSYGLTIHPTVQPRQKLTVQYGIYREKASFRHYQVYSNCNERTVKAGTAWAPYSKDFKISAAKL